MNNIENSRVVDTQLMYLVPGTSINRRFVWAGKEANTGKYQAYDVPIRDGRQIRNQFSLDKHGFALVNHHSTVSDFYQNNEIKAKYIDEIGELIKRETGANHVSSRGWMVRTSGDIKPDTSSQQNYQHTAGLQPVAGEVHVDVTQSSAERMAQNTYEQQFPDAPPYKRFIVFSIWRAFSPGPQDWPLAMCDNRSVSDSEGTPNTLVVVDKEPSNDQMFAEIEGEDKMIAASIFHYNEKHKWWYFSNMNRDEALMLKFYDSDHSRAWRVPHSAFYDPSLAEQAHVRESVEVRAVAYFT